MKVKGKVSVSDSELLWKHLLWASLALLELQTGAVNEKKKTNCYLKLQDMRMLSHMCTASTPPPLHHFVLLPFHQWL